MGKGNPTNLITFWQYFPNDTTYFQLNAHHWGGLCCPTRSKFSYANQKKDRYLSKTNFSSLVAVKFKRGKGVEIVLF